MSTAFTTFLRLWVLHRIFESKNLFFFFIFSFNYLLNFNGNVFILHFDCSPHVWVCLPHVWVCSTHVWVCLPHVWVCLPHRSVRLMYGSVCPMYGSVRPMYWSVCPMCKSVRPCSGLLAPFMRIQDSPGFWIPRFAFRIPGAGF